MAVDTAVMTVRDDILSVLLVRRREGHQAGQWALPGTFLRERETLERAVLRSLREKAGITGRLPQQLHVFDDPRRDDRGWVLSVAHVDLVPLRQLTSTLGSEDVELVSATDERRISALPYGHAAIVEKAVRWVQAAYDGQPDPGGLLEEPFTLRDLLLLHNAIAESPHQRDTFRRRMEPQLKATGQMSDGTRGRPSRLWTRHGTADLRVLNGKPGQSAGPARRE
ncbi:NUDIX domain-containing protein [Arthrobacter sp. 2YAF22_2]